MTQINCVCVCVCVCLYIIEIHVLFCLMWQCLTKMGQEVTRVSLVDSSGQCVLDELVKPQNPILNYLTRYAKPSDCKKKKKAHLNTFEGRLCGDLTVALAPEQHVESGSSLNT